MIRTSRIGFVHTLLAMFALAVVGQAARVQLFQGKAWRARAERQQFAAREMPAPRGQILDAAGLVLAQSRDMLQLAIAPREVKDLAPLRRALKSAGVSPLWIARAVDRRRAWVALPGYYLPTDVAAATALRGVYANAASVRAYAMSEGTRRLVGRVGPDSRPVDGIELALDSLLRGVPGSATLVRDLRGRNFESPAVPGIAARPGSTVVLTLNHELQEIAEHALGDAVAKMSAEGGDIVILDPQQGEILAMASRRSDPRATAATALTEPFEPGSTLKPFIAAGLLARGRVRESDSVDTGDGVLELDGRVIHDEHKIGRGSFVDVLQYSSNIGIVKFAQRLSAREQFETLRDFGFGTVTGVPYPSESNGTLRAPSRWSTQSAASLAMGYEIAVTPLQLAVAYGAFANGGELLEPALVKEIRSPDGTVRFRHHRRVVRRVLSPDVANEMRGLLLNVVENGTAVAADLSSYLLAGKTGTPRRTVNGRYAAQQYNPNFVGLFPADAPQYVIVVKLTNPRGAQGSYFGGATAAPLTKTVLEAAIAARDAALDRRQLAASREAAHAARPAKDSEGVLQVSPRTLAFAEGNVASPESARARAARHSVESRGSVPFIVTLPQRAPRARTLELPRAVPDVRGLDLRDAVRSLHTAGFQVQLLRGSGGITSPVPGTLAAPGTLVRLLYDF